MSFTTAEQELYDHLRASLPGWFWQKSVPEEAWGPFVKEFNAVRLQADSWLSMTFIKQATGMWLDQHARDRGTYRQGSESDPNLRNRLRTFLDMATVPAVKSAATVALTNDGVTIPSGYPAVVETRRDRAYMETWSHTATAPGSTIDRKMAYLSRGYRMTNLAGSIIVILPYTTTAATAGSVYESVRKRKAGGFKHVVERRVNP